MNVMKVAAAVVILAALPTGQHLAAAALAPSVGDICMDVRNGGTANGTAVQSYRCNGSGAQDWIYNGSRLLNTRSGKCLDGYDLAVGRPLYIWGCNGTRAQHWVRYSNASSGNPGFINPETGRCIDAFTRVDGLQLKVWSCNGTIAQFFQYGTSAYGFRVDTVWSPERTFGDR